MGDSLALAIGTPRDLAAYVANQLVPFGGAGDDRALLDAAIGPALGRFAPIAAAVRAFTPGRFDHLHSLQHAGFLYLLGRAALTISPASRLADKLFCLNKMLHSVELHPAVDLPGIFFLSHGLGAVVGNAHYGDKLVVFQHVTIGRVGENRPMIGDNVVLFAGATVTGRSRIGDNVVISAGARVHNRDVPPDSLVRGADDDLRIAPLTRDYLSLYFR